MMSHVQCPSLRISLLGQDGEVPARSGLNWWNAGGRRRNPDEVYVPLPSQLLEQAEAVFGSADTGTTFRARFHDRTEMEMQLEGEQGSDRTKAKQITSRGSKTQFGHWILRSILKLPVGEQVTRGHLERYGQTEISFTRVGQVALTGNALVQIEFLPSTSSDRLEVERLRLIAVAESPAMYNADPSFGHEQNFQLRAEAVLFHGTTCKGCGFDFAAKYGERGRDYIEIHLTSESTTVWEAMLPDPRTDMTVLCANCHRMVHRYEPVLTLSELRELIRAHSRT